MDERRKRILVTGATGYIGSRLLTTALASGLEVVAAVRNPARLAPAPRVRAVRFDLSSPQDLGHILARVDAIVHLAFVTDPPDEPSDGEDPNVRGSRALIEAARRHGVGRFIFLSSQSAREGAPSSYGRSKWQIERSLSERGEVVVRPGMVSGGPLRGVYGRLVRLCRGHLVLPIPRPGAPVYPVHVDDVCAVILDLVAGAAPEAGAVRLAPASSISFSRYLRTIAQARLGRRLYWIPVPSALVLALLRLGGAGLLRWKGSRGRLLGLIALPRMDPDASMIDLAPSAGLRDVAQALALEGRRRRLIAEGRALSRYLLGRRAPSGVVRRYVRAVLGEPDPTPLELPALVRGCPALLRAREPLGGGRGGKLTNRLALATRIVEMTPEAAPLFHNYRRRSRVIVLLELAWILLTEAVLLPIRAARRQD